MTNEEIAEQKEKAIRRAVAVMREHFDAVLVLASGKDANGNHGMIVGGLGDPMAKFGMAAKYVMESGK